MSLNSIEKNIALLKTALPLGSQVVVVTKYASLDQIQHVIDAGHFLLGENKVQDAENKQNYFDDTRVSWQLIGHLQTNKVKKAIQVFDCIQSVDSLKLLQKIQEESEKIDKITEIFIQLNFSDDSDRYGFDPTFVLKNHKKIFMLPNIKITGIMVLAPLTSNKVKTQNVFKETKLIFDDLKHHYPSLSTVSMGMSYDYDLALREGSNMIRIGRKIFNQEAI